MLLVALNVQLHRVGVRVFRSPAHVLGDGAAECCRESGAAVGAGGGAAHDSALLRVLGLVPTVVEQTTPLMLHQLLRLFDSVLNLRPFPLPACALSCFSEMETNVAGLSSMLVVSPHILTKFLL